MILKHDIPPNKISITVLSYLTDTMQVMADSRKDILWPYLTLSMWLQLIINITLSCLKLWNMENDTSRGVKYVS